MHTNFPVLRKTRCALAKRTWFENTSIYKKYYRNYQTIQRSTVQLNLNFTHACRYARVLACLTYAKLKKLVCARTVAHNFGVDTWNSECTRHTRDARHKLALGLPNYTCGVTTSTVAMKYNCFAADWLLIIMLQ